MINVNDKVKIYLNLPLKSGILIYILYKTHIIINGHITSSKPSRVKATTKTNNSIF